MSRKSNQTIFRVGSTKLKWSSNYIEKTSNESRNYIFKGIEIEKYVKLLFKKVGLIVQDYRIFINNLTINLCISYLITPKFVFYLNKINKKIKLKKKNSRISIKNKKRKKKPQKSKVFDLNNFNFNTKTSKIKIFNKLKRLKSIKKYKNYLNFELLRNKYFIKNSKNKFINLLYNNLKKFININFQLCIIMKNLNKNNTLNYKYKNKDLKKFKGEIAGLRKFKNSEFFKEGVNIFFNAICQSKSANIIAGFIALNMQKLKQHRFLLGFVEKILNILIKQPFSKINGIKIEIRGRINGAPRSKISRIFIGSVQLQSLNSFVDYSQEISYTNNGTLGIKVWVCSNHNFSINQQLYLK